jgi:alpha-L-fucosidase
MVVWGLFSVPGWAPMTGDLNAVIAEQGWEAFFKNNPYAEWYMNTLQLPGSQTADYHRLTYGEAFQYDDFVPQFQAALQAWNPDDWAQLFDDAGVRYTVFLTKHHDGFLLWNSQHPNPYKANYQTTRDIPAELAASLRARGIAFGIYYSGGLDWSFEPGPIHNFSEVYTTVPQSPEYTEYANAHWRELIA